MTRKILCLRYLSIHKIVKCREIEAKVYGDRFNKAFKNENELKKKIKVWHEMSNPNDLSET